LSFLYVPTGSTKELHEERFEFSFLSVLATVYLGRHCMYHGRDMYHGHGTVLGAGMSTNFPKPTIVISKCIGFDPCRYNGGIVQDKLVARLKPYIEVISVCPEVEIGLGIPQLGSPL
jgi:2-thiouracil desulfurase